MPPQPEDASEKGELFTGIEGIERGNALLEKLRELLPEEPIPDNAWEYSEFGEIIAIEYLKNLTMEVAMAGGQTENIHSQLHKLIEAEKKICRFPEKLRELDLTELDSILIALDRVPDHIIDQVSQIEDVTEAKADTTRQLMNEMVNLFGPILDRLSKTSKVFLDGQKTMYPDFWKAYNQVDTMRTAVGILGRDSIRRIPRV